MKPVSYLALVRNGERADIAASRAMASLPRSTAYVMQAGSSRLTLLVDPAVEVHGCIDEGGIVIGPVFSRDTNRPLNEGMQISRAGGRDLTQSLLQHHWGGYLAFIADQPMQRWTILRAPMGITPCYYVTLPGLIALASHVDLLVAAGLLEPEVDRGYIVEHLLHPEVRKPRTGLQRVTELLGGTSLTIAATGRDIEEVWSPWSFIGSRTEAVDREETAQSVRQAVLASTSAWARSSGQVLLTLSGGLDSSIVAACLARSGARYTCLTLRTDDAAGDEQAYAAATAAKIGAPLLSRHFTIEDVDVTRSDAAHLPRPLARSFLRGLDRTCERVVDEIGAAAIFNGAGGDNIFCLLHSAAPLADRLLAGDPIGAWRTLNDICRLTDSDYVSVLRRGLAKLPSRNRVYRWPIEEDFLSEEARRAANPEHPWLASPPGSLPGKAAHIALLLAIQNHLEGFASELTMPHISPLLSQPAVETCLAIPSWLWCSSGINRAIAREAFQDDLPPAVLHRRSKGTPDGFCAKIFQAQRHQLRELLADGLLASWGVIDREAVLAKINEAGPLRSLEHLRILNLADVEAWARTWDRTSF